VGIVAASGAAASGTWSRTPWPRRWQGWIARPSGGLTWIPSGSDLSARSRGGGQQGGHGAGPGAARPAACSSAGGAQLSQAHVYLTYPFVLSWSLLEAMSTACAIVGSATTPVKEVIQHCHNGLLVDFFSPEAIAEAVDQLLRDRKLAKQLGQQARNNALARYSLERCLPRQLELIDLVASGALGQ
jgi:hypothetical protein